MLFDTKGHCFERDIITLNVRWYLSYKLSYRDLGEMAAERGLEVDHTTIYSCPWTAYLPRKMVGFLTNPYHCPTLTGRFVPVSLPPIRQAQSILTLPPRSIVRALMKAGV